VRQAGAVLIGRTNMSEFAFSGIGLNPHYGHPLAPFERERQTVSGGSSSGAAASVADGMAAVALATDTGGSIRIPATFCELTGFKPTARRVPSTGAFPLSTSLDSIGPIGLSVDCCAIVDRVLAGLPPAAAQTVPLGARPLAGVRLGVLRNVMFSDADEVITAAFAHAARVLEAAGADIVEFTFAALDRLPEINKVGLSSIESYAYHRPLLDRASQYDHRVLMRIMRGEHVSASDYLNLLAERRAMIAAADQAFAPFDAVICPTVPIAPPRVTDLADDATFFRVNSLILRNPSVFNFLDGCALSLPCNRPGDAPAGLMLAGTSGRDDAILALGHRVEAALRAVRTTAGPHEAGLQ
jgi:aspartyl-tRNA(Asn)/glutamyl-tRNA(Gln) amidotransferase subunit A